MVILVDVDGGVFAGLVWSFCLSVDVLELELPGGDAETLDTTDEMMDRSTNALVSSSAFRGDAQNLLLSSNSSSVGSNSFFSSKSA